jgi:hypothetical protein
MLPTAHPKMNPAARIRIRTTAREVVIVHARKETLTFSIFWKTKMSARMPNTIPKINLNITILLYCWYRVIYWFFRKWERCICPTAVVSKRASSLIMIDV